MKYLLNDPNSRAYAAREFEQIFEVPFKNFYDAKTSALLGYVSIDLDKLDEWLQSDWDINAGFHSTKDLVSNFYGQEAIDLIENML